MFRSFLRDESGQSLAFAVLTFIIVILVACMVLGVGEATSVQMELQNSADAAAYSGAQVMADCVAQIAWINEAMARVYYSSLRYAVDTASLSVLAEMRQHQPWYGTPALWAGDGMPAFTLTPTNAQVWGRSESPVDAYDHAYDTAKVWIPKGQEWLRRLSRLQRGIALLAPVLVDRQISATAMMNIYTGDIEDRLPSFATFPASFEFIPVGPSKRSCHLTRIPGGWDIFDEEGFRFKAEHNEPAGNIDPALPDDLWAIVYTNNGAEAKTIDITTFNQPAPTIRYEYSFKITQEGTALPDIRVWVFDDGRVEVLQGDETTEINVYDGPPRVYEVIEPGNKITRIRYTTTGVREYWMNGPDGTDDDLDGISDDDEWITPGGSGTSTDIQGVQVPISFTSHIDIGTNMSIDIGDPVVIHIHGMHIALRDPMNISFSSPYGWLSVTDERASIDGLNTEHHDDGRWRRDGHHNWFWGDRDNIRHRLKVIEEENIPAESGRWLYEWVRIGSYMTEMSNKFFAIHSIMDHDPYYKAQVPDESARFSGPTPEDDAAWKSAPSTSRWNHFPRWARPQRLEEGVADGNFGGWFSLDTGKPYDLKAYSQTRSCWGCDKAGWQPSMLGGRLHDFDLSLGNPTSGQLCLRPCGFIYHLVTPGVYTSEENLEESLLNPINSAIGSAGLGVSSEGGIFEISDKTLNGERISALALLDGHPAGSRVFQVACPVCLRRVASIKDYYQGPPYSPEWTRQLDVPSVVRKYLAHGMGRYDRSGAMRNQDVNYSLMPSSSGDDNFISVPSAVSFQEAQGKSNPRWLKPLQATSEIFRTGITVAVWKEAVEDRFFKGIGQSDASMETRRRGVANPLKSQSWGHFGLASARLVFWNYDFDGLRNEGMNGRMMTPVKAVTFPWDSLEGGGSRPGWITETDEEIDIVGRPIHWHREMWLRSHANLFNPDWDARIVQVKHALNVFDLYTTEEIAEGLVEDSGVSYLMRMIQGGRWRASPIDSGYGQHNSDPRVQSDWGLLGIDFSSEEVENVIKH